MLSGVPSSASRSNSSVRISASARVRSALASASRFSRFSSLRWTLALSSRYCGRAASTRAGRAGAGVVEDGVVSPRVIYGSLTQRIPRNARRFSGSARTSSRSPRSWRVKLPNWVASSDWLVRTSGTPEFSAVDTVR